MNKYGVFGVKSKSMNTAREWAEKALGMKATGRMSDYKGHYYTFDIEKIGDIELIPGIMTDQDETYPAEPDFPDWALLLRFNNMLDTSAQLASILDDSEHFQKLST
jgi:hypothetical protein